ncbi:MAG: T9SS type A sorting domain-containing protein, partial [Melioribacteraceae bacterium]
GSEKITPAVDNIFGFAINQHDNDETKARVASLTWAAKLLDALWNTPKYLGTAKFLAGNKLQYIPTNNMTGSTNTIPYDGSDLVGVDDVNLLPTEFAVSQNYPNPFNPTTMINYALPKKANVKLVVFNTIGQQVATLVNQEMIAGYHSINFDASKLSSGIYFYTLSAGDFISTQKMILLK